jgi:DNA-binding CsgD family transcriptional regulator
MAFQQLDSGSLHEELELFRGRLSAAIVGWMPITQTLDGVTCFAENALLGDYARVDGLRASVVGQPLTSSWDPAAPAPDHINRFTLPTQRAMRKDPVRMRPVINALYGPARVSDTMRMLAYDGALCLGWFGVLRADDDPDFSSLDLRRARAEAPYWASRIAAQYRQEKKLLHGSPAHIVVDEAGHILAASREVEPWLSRARRQRISDAAAHVRREGPTRLLIDRYLFDGITILGGSSSVVYLNAPLGTFGSVALCVLSPRQRQVVDLVVLGMSNQECAEELSLSVHTVKQHLAAAYRLLGISRREELVVMLRAGA